MRAFVLVHDPYHLCTCRFQQHFADSTSLGTNRLRGISQRAGFSRSSTPIGAFRLLKVPTFEAMYVTKKIYEIPHLANFYASEAADGEVVITEALPAKLPKTKVIVLEDGRIVFAGTVKEFQKSDLPGSQGIRMGCRSRFFGNIGDAHPDLGDDGLQIYIGDSCHFYSYRSFSFNGNLNPHWRSFTLSRKEH